MTGLSAWMNKWTGEEMVNYDLADSSGVAWPQYIHSQIRAIVITLPLVTCGRGEVQSGLSQNGKIHISSTSETVDFMCQLCLWQATVENGPQRRLRWYRRGKAKRSGGSGPLFQLPTPTPSMGIAKARRAIKKLV